MWTAHLTYKVSKLQLVVPNLEFGEAFQLVQRNHKLCSSFLTSEQQRNPKQKSTKERWRDHRLGSKATLVPVPFVLRYADPQEIGNKKVRDAKRIETLYFDLEENGFETPLEMYLDSVGKLRLQEGYHRIAAVTSYKSRHSHVPVVIHRSSGRIKVHSINVVEDFEQIVHLLTKK